MASELPKPRTIYMRIVSRAYDSRMLKISDMMHMSHLVDMLKEEFNDIFQDIGDYQWQFFVLRPTDMGMYPVMIKSIHQIPAWTLVTATYNLPTPRELPRIGYVDLIETIMPSQDAQAQYLHRKV
jgi:hypothetical protein